MGTVGWISSGGVIYNHLSNPDGSLAAYEEIESLDSCGGHSDPSKQYHYHLVISVSLKVYFDKSITEFRLEGESMITIEKEKRIITLSCERIF